MLTLVSIHISANEEEFLGKKFEIIDKNLVKAATKEGSWLISKDHVNSTPKDIRKLKFIVLYIIESWFRHDT